MGKKTKLYLLVSIALIYGLLNLILFLTIPEENLKNFTFWLSWVFTFVVSYGALFTVIHYLTKKFQDITVPPSLFVSGGFTLAYLVSGFIFMYIKTISWKPIVVVEALISVAYFIVLFALLRATNYMNENINKRKAKVFYIRDLQSDVDYVYSLVSNNEIRQKLSKLSEDIRFSDPMSHESLKMVEEQLKEIVFKMNVAASENNDEELEKLIKEADLKLKYRNSKCVNLK